MRFVEGSATTSARCVRSDAKIRPWPLSADVVLSSWPRPAPRDELKPAISSMARVSGSTRSTRPVRPAGTMILWSSAEKRRSSNPTRPSAPGSASGESVTGVAARATASMMITFMTSPIGAARRSRERTSEESWRQRAQDAEHATCEYDDDDVEPPLPEGEHRERGEAEHDGDPVDRAGGHERDLRQREGDREDEAHDAGRDPAQELLQERSGREPVHVSSCGQHEQESRQEHPERRERGPEPRRACALSSEEANEDPDRDERARRGLSQRQCVDHLAVGDPSVGRDRTFADVRQHRVGATEREEPDLGEEPGDVEEARSHGLGGVGPGGEQGGGGRRCRARARPELPPCDERESACEEDQQEGQPREVEGYERSDGEDDRENTLQRGTGDAHEGCQQQGEPHRAKAPQDAEDLGRLPVVNVDPGERGERDVAWQDEEDPCEDAGQVARLLVSDVDRELQRLGAGEQVAEVERADELVLADPFLALDDLQVHEADLADRATEGEPSELEEVPEDLGHRDLLDVSGWRDGRRR